MCQIASIWSYRSKLLSLLLLLLILQLQCIIVYNAILYNIYHIQFLCFTLRKHTLNKSTIQIFFSKAADDFCLCSNFTWGSKIMYSVTALLIIGYHLTINKNIINWYIKHQPPRLLQQVFHICSTIKKLPINIVRDIHLQKRWVFSVFIVLVFSVFSVFCSKHYIIRSAVLLAYIMAWYQWTY